MALGEKQEADRAGGRSLRRPKRLLVVSAALLLISVLVLVLVSARPQYRVYLAFEDSNRLRVTILHRMERDRDECDRTRNLMAQAVAGACSACRILDNRCLGRIDADQRKVFSDEPLAIPAAHIPNAVVTYTSADPPMALEACKLSEQYATRTGQPGQVICFPPNTKRLLSKKQSAGLESTTDVFRFAAQVVAALGAIFAIMLASRFVVVRSPTESREEHPYSETPVKISNVAKRFFDVLSAASLLLFLFPVLILVSALILFLEGLPIFYVSRRFISLNHSVPILKFRTMARDAASPKYRLKERFMRQGYLDIPLDCEVFTPIGRILERTQLVEVLQCFNVLVHGMSFVGNRPLPRENIELLKVFNGWECRFRSPAGITGLSQVVGKFNQTPAERLELECLYSSVYSSDSGNILLCDFAILIATIRVLVFGKYLSFGQAKRLVMRASGRAGKPLHIVGRS